MRYYGRTSIVPLVVLLVVLLVVVPLPVDRYHRYHMPLPRPPDFVQRVYLHYLHALALSMHNSYSVTAIFSCENCLVIGAAYVTSSTQEYRADVVSINGHKHSDKIPKTLAVPKTQ